ncbi:hypothetical protein ESCO_000216 [Escovopsis weberi]|uniref:Uncharacterized protein n=1 Tax=Escovopsis weberi TaxID=150374 RepID=A0A0M8N3X6_ESCWE|nr:hypothetical protein ESCO_000216 [Escovopsis weberi]
MTSRFLPRSPLIAAILIILLCLVGFQFRHYVYEDSIPQRVFPEAAAWLTPQEHEAAEPKFSVRTSRLHYLVPASQTSLVFCYHLASAAANQFPAPILIGWQGAGELDAAKTHLAKLRALQRYLNDTLIPAGNAKSNEDDLVILADGYDVVVQLPPDIWLERYFEIATRADARLAERFGLSVNDLHARGLRETIFWGSDKFCWPWSDRAARCWAAPPFPDLDSDPAAARGKPPKLKGYGRWLNSGTVIGPLGDMKRYIDATMDEISATHDPAFQYSESDQFYLANVWGLQEFSRSLMLNGGGTGDDAADAAAAAAVSGGPANRVLPSKRHPDQQTELHVSLDYESALFMTRAGNEAVLANLRFNASDLSAALPVKAAPGAAAAPRMRMPANVEAALTRLYDAVPGAHPAGATAAEWIRDVVMGVNFVTRQIYGMWHCTGAKDRIAPDYEAMWFRPFVAPLMRANVRASQAAAGLLSEKLFDGRRWEARTAFPQGADGDELGGAWADVRGGGFLPWRVLCGAHQEMLFKGSAP